MHRFSSIEFEFVHCSPIPLCVNQLSIPFLQSFVHIVVQCSIFDQKYVLPWIEAFIPMRIMNGKNLVLAYTHIDIQTTL